MDVNLISKDMELNFSNKNDDEDETELKNGGLENEDATEDFKPEKFGIAPEEQKDLKIAKKDMPTNNRPTGGRGKLQEND